MKKKVFFLIAIIGIFLSFIKTTNAKTVQFYEADYTGNSYLTKYDPRTRTKYFQRARMFKEQGTYITTYCIEPFTMFNENAQYESVINPGYLSNEQIERIKALAYYGYLYKDHTNQDWYTVTQFLIWQTADPVGDYYFTDTLNGNRITKFTNEINELNNLVENNKKEISFNNQEITLTENEEFVLTDTNNQISNYTTNDDIEINENTISKKDLKEGTYEFTFTKNYEYYKRAAIIYKSPDSQDMIELGDLENKIAKVKVNVIKTSINLTKIDKDTKDILPQGDASLDGAKYILYDENNNVIQEVEIKNNIAKIENIKLGKYYLLEKEPGEGYTKDENEYEINITKENPNVDLTLENKVIEKEITINKKYGENDNFINEKNIDFEIHNSKNELIKTISTNEEGIINIKLPYGKYTLTQINTTEGYQKIEPLELNIKDNIPENIELKDYKIPVPNTHTSILSKLLKIFLFIIIVC